LRQRHLWRAYRWRREIALDPLCREIHIDAPVAINRFALVIGMSFVSELRRIPAPEEDTFNQLVAILWILSEIAFDVFGTFFGRRWCCWT